MKKEMNLVEYVTICYKNVTNGHIWFYAIDALAFFAICYKFGIEYTEKEWMEAQYPSLLDSLFDVYSNGTELGVIFCCYYVIKLIILTSLMVATFPTFKKEHGYV